MKNIQTIKNVVFAVCHPDDEAVWCGGMLYEFSKFEFVKTHVICLSGRDPNSPREQEFHEAAKVAGYTRGVVVGGPLRPALNPISDVIQSIEEGLSSLGLLVSEIDLLITHSPFGDEHMHPHHIQAYNKISEWTRSKHVPFGFFSCLPITAFIHKNILTRPKRSGTLQVLSLAECSLSIHSFSGIISRRIRPFTDCPKIYVQFLTDLNRKIQMLSCYKSTNLKVFQDGYASFDNPCEALYLRDSAAFAPIKLMLTKMDVPDDPELFDFPQLSKLILRQVNLFLKRLFFFKNKGIQNEKYHAEKR